MGALQRFWAKGAGHRVAVIVTAVLLVLLTVSGLLLAVNTLTGGSLVEITRQGTSSGKGTPVVKQVASATPTPTNSSPTVGTGGPPELGAPLPDFVAAYGPVVSPGVGGTDKFYADKAKTIVVNVKFTNAAASTIAAMGPTSWTNSRTFDFCATFLPPQATRYNSVNNSVATYTDYHSSLGDLVLVDYGEGTCLVYLVA